MPIERVAHLLLHKVPWGWRVHRVHRVHHSDVVVDVTTALRQHPGETVWRVAFRVPRLYGLEGFDDSVSQSLGGLLRMPVAKGRETS
jgi:Fatty acid hydroxylase